MDFRIADTFTTTSPNSLTSGDRLFAVPIRTLWEKA